VLRVLEVLSTVVYLLAFLVLGLRVQHLGGLEVPRLGVIPPLVILPVLASLAVMVLVVSWSRFRERIPRGILAVLVILPLAGVGVAGWKVGTQILDRRKTDDGNPRHIFVRAMTEAESHLLALRLVATAISDQALTSGAPPSDPGDVMVPAEWPLPEGFRFGVVHESDRELAVWSDRNGKTCRIGLSSGWRQTLRDFGFTCTPLDATKPVSWGEVRRSATSDSVTRPTAPPFPPWPQYRLDFLRSATATDSSLKIPPPLWYAAIAGSVRASPSVSGPLVLIGTHGTGVLEAHDRVTGDLVWRAQEPNWIHQDVVSDGTRAFVGFGDSEKSFQGAALAGVAAHDVRTGQRIWTRFMSTSVMTSPVLLDSLVVFGDALGTVLGVEKTTGQILWETHLPGNLIMGPPVLVGDTLLVPLDPRGMCALLGASGERLWCTKLPRRGTEVGHISPAVAWNQIYGTMNVFPPTTGGLFWGYGVRALPMLWSRATTGAEPVQYHQVSFSLSLHTGVLLWQSPFDENQCCDRAQWGHHSGTPVPVIDDTTLIVVSPISNRIYRLDAMTGERLATGPTMGVFPRGPALVVDTTVLAADRDGLLHVLNRDTLTERCALSIGSPFDRTGPTLADGALLLAGRDGSLYSLPLTDVLRCDPTLSARITELRERILAADH